GRRARAARVAWARTAALRVLERLGARAAAPVPILQRGRSHAALRAPLRYPRGTEGGARFVSRDRRRARAPARGDPVPLRQPRRALGRPRRLVAGGAALPRGRAARRTIPRRARVRCGGLARDAAAGRPDLTLHFGALR